MGYEPLCSISNSMTTRFPADGNLTHPGDQEAGFAELQAHVDKW